VSVPLLLRGATLVAGGRITALGDLGPVAGEEVVDVDGPGPGPECLAVRQSAIYR